MTQRSLTAQIGEIETTIRERRSGARTPQAEYRLQSLDSVLETLRWLERNQAEIRRLLAPAERISGSTITR